METCQRGSAKMSREPHTGQCACGQTRFRLVVGPMFTHCCHCSQCQRLTGSAFVLNAIIENDNIELLSGEVILTPGPSESGRAHDIYRCGNCMTAVWSDYGGRSNYRFVRVGILDDPSAITPDAHIYTRSKLDWVIIPPDQRAFETEYILEQEWTPRQLERRARAIGSEA
jgi:hypothetical protein